MTEQIFKIEVGFYTSPYFDVILVSNKDKSIKANIPVQRNFIKKFLSSEKSRYVKGFINKMGFLQITEWL